MVKRVLETFRIEGGIRSATDPFFLDDYDAKRLYQIGFDLKHEARAEMPDGASMAIASVNYHQDHLASRLTLGPSGDSRPIVAVSGSDWTVGVQRSLADMGRVRRT